MRFRTGKFHAVIGKYYTIKWIDTYDDKRIIVEGIVRINRKDGNYPTYLLEVVSLKENPPTPYTYAVGNRFWMDVNDVAKYCKLHETQ